MINIRDTEIIIVNSLQKWLKIQGYECPVIRSNQTAPIPKYPYISYTITTPVVSDAKGYSISKDGTRYKSLVQVWSFTVQSDDDEEANNVALQAYDWFAAVGNLYLSDNGIVPQRVRNVSNRDNLLTIEYEYRRGFDVDFLLMHEIPDSAFSTEEFGVEEIVEAEIHADIDGKETSYVITKEE